MTLLRIIWILPMMAVVVASVLLIVVIPTSSSSSSSTTSSSSSSSSFRSLYYQRYKFYPPYCSTPEQMSTRNIPPLRDDYYVDNKNKNENNSNNNNNNNNNNSFTENDNSNNNNSNNNSNNNNNKRLIGETRLVHVTAIIRHGARTPWSNEMKCWEGFWDSPDTGIWDCDDLTTFMTSPSRNGTTTTSTGTSTGISTASASTSASPSTKTMKSVVDPAFFLFEKRYDALNFPNDGLTNALNGTCQMGQLLQQGYDQQIKNGKLIRDAYTYKKGEYDHDERMRLLDISLEDYLPWETNKLYFRADDDQRTIMSGQVLLRGLFDPELIKINNINNNNNNNNVNGGNTNGSNNNNNNNSPVVVIPLHIADRDKDIMDANDNDCPKLDTIKDEARQSPEYQKFMNSQQSQDVRQYAAEQMGIMDPNDVYPMDCLMCTICTDRSLPNATNDYDSTKNNWFSKLVEYEIQQYTILMKYNNAQWAKLALGPLWYEIMKNINPYINEESDDENDDNIAAPRLALFAGHDTTLMPLLASLGSNLWNDTDWPSYASMILIEIHELIDGRSDPDIYTSKFAFRLIYNGKILTSLVHGCHDDCELCDIVHLKSKLDPIATRDKDCSEIKIPTTSTSSTTNDGVGGSFGDDVPEGVTDISSVAAREESFSSFLLLSTTTGIVIFVSVIVLSGLLGSSFTFLIMRRFSNNNNNSTNNHSRVPVDYGDAWDINNDDNNDDNNVDYSFEMTTSESRFRDELPDHDEF